MSKYEYVQTRREEAFLALGKKLSWYQKTRMRLFTKWHVFVFMLSKGQWMNTRPRAGRPDIPYCMVTMIGKKSGKKRRIMLGHIPLDDGSKAIVASLGGTDENPLWYYNIKANPHIEIMADGVTRRYVARQVDDEEKALLWPQIIRTIENYDHYQAYTERNIPVFKCEPKS